MHIQLVNCDFTLRLLVVGGTHDSTWGVIVGGKKVGRVLYFIIGARTELNYYYHTLFLVQVVCLQQPWWRLQP